MTAEALLALPSVFATDDARRTEKPLSATDGSVRWQLLPSPTPNVYALRATGTDRSRVVTAADAVADELVASAAAADAKARRSAARRAEATARAERATLEATAGDPAALATSRAVAARRLVDLRDRASATRSELADAQAAVAAASSKPGPDEDASARASFRAARLRDALAADELHRAAVAERTASAKEYWGELGAGKTEEHRDVVLARRRLDTAETAVARRRAAVEAEVGREADADRDAARARRRSELAARADATARRLDGDTREIAEAEREVAKLDADARAAAAARRRIAELDEAIAALKAGDVNEAVTPAAAPRVLVRATSLPQSSNERVTERVAPATVEGSTRSTSVTLVGCLVGAALGGGLGLLGRRRAAFPTRTDNPALAPMLPASPPAEALNVIARLPDLAAWAADPTEGGRRLESAFRDLRSALVAASAGRTEVALTWVVSPLPGHGASSVTWGLTAALAAAGRSALLVDANLFRPTLHTRAGIDRCPGLADAVAGTAEPAECLAPLPGLPGSHLLPAGLSDVDPSDLLSWPGLSAFLRTLGHGYDHVLIDSPPFGPHGEMFGAPGDDDLLVCVYRSVEENPGGISAALRRFRGTQVGVVLNCVGPSSDRATKALAPDR